MKNKLLSVFFCSGLLLWAAHAHAEKLVRAPYLQSTNVDSAILVWTTDVDAPSEVHYGVNAADLNQSIKSDLAVKQHEIKISGLAPDTKYYYLIGSSGNKLAGGDSAHYFVTNPQPMTKKKFRAWILGDSGDGGVRQAAVRDQMLGFTRTHRPELFLHVGDMAYSYGTTDEFTKNFFAPYAPILQNTNYWPTMGNHEGYSAYSGTETGPYYTAFVLPRQGEVGGIPSGTEAYYSYDYANVHFIVLNSHDVSRAPDGPMLTWLKSDLAATKQDWIIAYWHHPPYSKGSHDSDLEVQLVEMRQNAVPILEDGGVDVVLSGHSHNYERSFLIDGAYDTPTTVPGHIVDMGDGKPLGNGPYAKPAGIAPHKGTVYVVCGHGGVVTSAIGKHPLVQFQEVTNGSCVLDVQENRLSLVNIRWDAAITDRFAMVKGTGIIVAAPDGGETLAYGDSYDIRWATVGNVPNVNIDYSTDEGQTYTTIASSIPNTGVYTWPIPAIDSKKTLVRVSDTTNSATFDESNAQFTLIGGAPFDVISFGSTWFYRDDGVDQGINWLAVNFDDSNWKFGNAQLGYGEGDEATTLIHVTPNYPSVYFRQKFTLDREITQAELTALHDDGVIVWINGRQVYSKYVGDPWYGAFATAQSKDNQIDTAPVLLNDNPFVIGENVVAVMVKQVNETSSDISFDFNLVVRKAVNESSSVSSSSSSGDGGNSAVSSSSVTGEGGNGAGGTNSGGQPPVRESVSCAYHFDQMEPVLACGWGLILVALWHRRKSAGT